METPLISLKSASERVGLNSTEFLRKCQEIALPAYYSPPSSLSVWEFKTITDDPSQGLFARISGLPGPNVHNPLRKRYLELDLPPRVLKPNCYFRLGDREITGLLQKGTIESKGFTHCHQLDGRVMKPAGEDFPRTEELALFDKHYSKARLAKKPPLPFSISYCNEFYGLTPTERKPSEREDLSLIAIGYEYLWIERNHFAQLIEKFEPSDAEIILEVFPELKDAIDADNCLNQIPHKMVSVLAICIRAWKKCQPGQPLRSEAAWAKETLDLQPDMTFSKETLDKICTLFTTDFNYTQGDQSHQALADPSRPGSKLFKKADLPLAPEVRKSGLLVLVDAWTKNYKDADLWDDSNKKPDNKKCRAIEEAARAFLEAYLTGKLARHMLLILKETKPWQD